MSRLLITPSLFNAWRFYRLTEDAEAARKDMITTLRREQIVPNEMMLAGRTFEDDIQKHATGQPDLLLDLEDPPYQDCVHEVAAIVKGGLFQEKIYHDLHFRGHGDFLLYGRVDVVKGPWDYDIKFVRRYDIGKYYHNIQHTAYMAGSGQKRFGYLISDGRQVWREDYFWQVGEYQQMVANLRDMIEDFKRDREFAKLYETHWIGR